MKKINWNETETAKFKKTKYSELNIFFFNSKATLFIVKLDNGKHKKPFKIKWELKLLLLKVLYSEYKGREPEVLFEGALFFEDEEGKSNNWRRRRSKDWALVCYNERESIKKADFKTLLFFWNSFPNWVFVDLFKVSWKYHHFGLNNISF